jgi:hypothetical protein
MVTFLAGLLVSIAPPVLLSVDARASGARNCNDLYANEIEVGAATQAVAAKPSTPSGGPAAAPPAESQAIHETEAIKMLRGYRTPGATLYRMVRGEFHRHSEISMDGG